MARDHSRTPRGGHSGEGGSESCPLSTQEINQLIFDREKARQNKDFATADALRKELSEGGVTLWDKRNTWNTSDGRAGVIPSYDDVQNGIIPQPVHSAGDVSTTEADHIKHQVLLREQARASKNFAESDRMRDELKAIGVELYDKEKTWKQETTGLQGTLLGYGQSGKGPTDLEIQTLVKEREKARENKDFPKSDMIRDELKAQGVIILDKEKIWKSKDGRSGAVPSFDTVRNGGTVAINKPGQSMPITAATNAAGGVDLNQTILNAAVVGQQNPLLAQQTLQLLAQLAQTGQTATVAQATALQTATPSAMVVGAAGGAIPAGTLMQALQFMRQCKQVNHKPSDQEILWLITTREKLRFQKDFRGADSMREAMKQDVAVTLYEKEKRWQCLDGRGGAIPTWSELGVNA